MRKERKESEWSQATRGALNQERKQILDYIEHRLDEGSTIIEDILDEVRRGKHRRSDTRKAVQAARGKKYPKKRAKKRAKKSAKKRTKKSA